MTEVGERIKAPCSMCIRWTMHNVLSQARRSDEFFSYDYSTLSCGGCDTVSMMVVRNWLTPSRDDETRTYYPSPVSRKIPAWLAFMRLGVTSAEEEGIGDLMHEVYAAVDAKQYRLAAMGIRATLEQVMILKVGDLQTFNQKLDAFEKAGFISSIQRESMRATLDVGDAAMHRGFVPKERELAVALDVVEGVMAPIFGHYEDAKALSQRVPARK